MALLRCDFFSDVLEVGTSMTVLLPQDVESQIGVSTSATGRDGFPVLYLLHGLSDDSTAWSRFTSIERYAAEVGVAVVMPQVQRSFYADEAHGARFWTFLSSELPDVVGSFLRVSQRREDTFVAGLSMGGYGALKWALHQPQRFAAAASLSGALDLHALLPERRPLFDRVFDGQVGPDDDLFALLAGADTDALPALFVGCGTEDPLYGSSVRFSDEAAAAGVDVHVDFRPGEHEWGLWDATIRDVLAWLPLRP
ncbi:MAG TPA: alpha/beta hydrolase family protein [Nocardioidaceae bacterium]|nr:alpha/beta hydrolase family protein [Nocardioidaceae bacterium]